MPNWPIPVWMEDQGKEEYMGLSFPLVGLLKIYNLYLTNMLVQVRSFLWKLLQRKEFFSSHWCKQLSDCIWDPRRPCKPPKNPSEIDTTQAKRVGGSVKQIAVGDLI